METIQIGRPNSLLNSIPSHLSSSGSVKFTQPPFSADVIFKWSLARQCGVVAVACPGNVVAAQHDGFRRGEESVDVKCGFATLEEQMRQDRTDGDDSVEIGR